jgi:hypothetical protein
MIMLQMQNELNGTQQKFVHFISVFCLHNPHRSLSGAILDHQTAGKDCVVNQHRPACA